MEPISQINSYLAEVEEAHELSIIFAVESGSRAWNMESEDSDFDVRFVYNYGKTRYLRVFPEIDETIEKKHGSILTTTGDVPCDLVGWDIYKFLRLLHNSNPTAIEWIISPIVYREHKILIQLRQLVEEFSRKALFLHYISLARSNYERYIKDKPAANGKKFLYVLRGICNSIFIFIFDKLPPVDIQQVMDKLYTFSNQDVQDQLEQLETLGLHIIEFRKLKHEIDQLIHTKKSGDELDHISVSSQLLGWTAKSFEIIKPLATLLETRDHDINAETLEKIVEEIL